MDVDTEHVVTLVKKVGSSLFSVLSNIHLTDELPSRQYLVKLEESFLELEAIWNSQSLHAPTITEELLNLKSGFEMFSDYIYRASKS